MNPILEQQRETEEERNRREAYRFPVRVHYVYYRNEPQDPNDPDITLVRDFCKKNSIYFLAREYNMDKYTEDCDYIRRLPAFQVYYDGSWDSVCYYPLSAISIAKKLIVEYEEKQRRLQDWGKKRNRIAEFFRNLFRKKSLMEKLQTRRSF